MNHRLLLGTALTGLAALAAAAAPDRAAVTAARPDADARAAIAVDAAYAQGTRSTRAPVANPSRGGARPLVVSEGFEGVEKILETASALGGGIYANGWIRRNNSDAPYTAWYKGATDAFQAYDGAPDSYLAQNWFATRSNTGTASVWALTPPVNFGAGATVSFWTRTVENATQADRLQVRVCATGDCTDVGTLPEDVGNFATLVADINATETVGGYPEQWTRYVLTNAHGLPTSGTGRIAFRYYFHQPAGTLAGNYIGIDRVEIDEGDAVPNGIDLAVTVAPADPAAPDACGTATSLDVAVGDQINVCYRVTNTSAAPLAWHSLRDDAGPVFANREHAVAPGATWQFNRVVTVAASQSPSVTWVAQRDRPGYTPDDTQPAQYVDTTGGDELDPQEVWGGATVPFPSDFDFRLYGERIDELCVMGYAYVGNKHMDFCPTYTAGLPPLPDGNLTGVFGAGMALYQSYMQFGGRYFRKVLGTAPYRRYVIEYSDNPVAFGSTDPGRGLTAQIVLNETTNVIEFQYRNLVFGGHPVVAYGGRASVGLQMQQIGQQYSYMTPSLRSVTRIAWRPSDPTAYTRTRQVHVTAHAPALRVDAASITATAPSHGTASTTLAIANDGAGRLDWTTGVDTSATSHFPASPRVVTRRADVPFDPLATIVPRRAGNARTEHAAAAGTTWPLWTFDIANGYLLQTTRVEPGYGTNAGAIRGYPRSRLITGAEFIDDDFDRLYAYDTASHALLRYEPITSAPNVIAWDTVVGIAALPTDEFGHGLKQDPTTGAVYLVTTTGQRSRLWTIDIATAAVREVGEIAGMPGVLAIAFDADGRLYGIDGIFDALIAIDKTTAAAQAIGNLGVATGARISALAFDPTDGALYFGGSDGLNASLYHVDATTGEATYVAMLLGPEGTGAQFGAMAFAHRASRCTQPADVPWLVPALAGGSIASGAAPTPLALGFDAASLADGVYTANLCIHSNDPLRRRTALPVTLTVGRGDAIFADGFGE